MFATRTKPERRRMLRGRGRLLSSAIGSLALLASTAAACPAQGPYEPNDSLPTATPITAGPTYSAALETANDRDLFSFYVAERQTQITIAVTNTTPGTSGQAFVNGGLYNARLKRLAALDDGMFGLAEGESGQMAYTFQPGRYLVGFEEGFAADPGVKSYRFALTGNVADEATMNALCGAARDRLRTARKALKRTRKRLKRARQGGSTTAVKRARKNVRTARTKHRRAKRAVRLYCVTR